MQRFDHPSRPQFEEWLKSTMAFKRCAQRGKAMWFTIVFDGSYRDFRVNDRWNAWCAAIRLTGDRNDQG